MNIMEYVEKARSTAIYPEEAKFFYPAFGLCGEIGELIDKDTAETASKTAIQAEMGDVLWYIVNTALDAEIDFRDIVTYLSVHGHVNRFNDLNLTFKNSYL